MSRHIDKGVWSAARRRRLSLTMKRAHAKKNGSWFSETGRRNVTLHSKRTRELKALVNTIQQLLDEIRKKL